MIYTIYDQDTGEITKIGVCSDLTEVDIQTKGDTRKLSYISNIQADPRTHKVKNGQIVKKKEADPIGERKQHQSN